MTQHQRILLAARKGWLCNDDFHKPPIQSWSPHKRRKDIYEGRYTELDGTAGKAGKYQWEIRTCTHGIQGSYDYLLKLKETGMPVASQRIVHSREEMYELEDRGWHMVSRDDSNGFFKAVMVRATPS